ncbi:unnamed protein product, partial [Prorocentrum cordatum]
PPGVGPHQMCGAGTAQGARALPLARAGGEACWGGPRPRQDCRTCAARPPRLGHGGAQAFLESFLLVKAKRGWSIIVLVLVSTSGPATGGRGALTKPEGRASEPAARRQTVCPSAASSGGR